MTLPTSGNPISFSQLRSEFGTDGNNTSGPVRIGQYRRDDSSYTSKSAGTFTNQPIDTGVPTSGTIAASNLHGKSLNVIVDYHSGSAVESGTRVEDARTRYTDGSASGNWTVIGGYKTPPSNSGGTKVKINVNKGLGSQAVGGNGVEICALRTGTWDANTILSVDVGASGKIRGAGGDGGPGGDNENAGSNGEEGNSALGIQYSGTTVNVASGGQIICGYGGGGGENGEADGGEAGRGRDQTSSGNGGASETGIANGEGGAGGSGSGGNPGSDGWAIRKSASGITYTLNNSGTVTGQKASTSSGGSGTSVG